MVVVVRIRNIGEAVHRCCTDWEGIRSIKGIGVTSAVRPVPTSDVEETALGLGGGEVDVLGLVSFR